MKIVHSSPALTGEVNQELYHIHIWKKPSWTLWMKHPTQVWAVSYCVHVSQPIVWRMLSKECLHPFHIQNIKVLQMADYPLRFVFCQTSQLMWYSQIRWLLHMKMFSMCTILTCGQQQIHMLHVHIHSNNTSLWMFGWVLWMIFPHNPIFTTNVTLWPISYFSLRGFTRIAAICFDCHL